MKRGLIYTAIMLSLWSCKKYLDEKPIKNTVVPSTLKDLQALLDNHEMMNVRSPELLELASDNYYVTTTDWSASPVEDRLNYIWDEAAFWKNSWILPYQGPIYYSNVILDQLSKINPSENERSLYNSVRGAALFFRSYSFYQLAQLYCQPFTTSSQTDLGIVLRLAPGVEEKSFRSSVQETYDQIINDLKEASEILPDTSAFPSRPNKAAAYGLLARCYLSMRDYVNASHFANLCLQKHHALIDYNTLIPVSFPPIQRFNKETIFYSRAYPNAFVLYPTYGKIDTLLYESYDANDLRKETFFKDNGDGTFGFQGSYDGTYWDASIFDGIATDEIYLIQAECQARQGNVDAALISLNTLMKQRWKNNGTWIPFTATDAVNALNKILVERRKELVYRGLRWSDIRRLNLEGANISLKRMINGTTYTLPPNDLRWVMLIPPEVINLSGVSQNPR